MSTPPDTKDTCTAVRSPSRDELKKAVADAKRLASEPFTLSAEDRRQIKVAVMLSMGHNVE